MAEAFTAGVRPGGLTDDTQIRMLLCYLVKVAGPVKHETLQGALLQEQLVNYFEFADALAEVEKQKLVTVDSESRYTITRKGATVYGTPWDGKEHLSRNIACPLKAVCILTRSETNHIERISPKEALTMLCQQSYRPAQPAALRKTLALVDLLSSSVPLYKLGCNMEPEAALVAYHGMNQ